MEKLRRSAAVYFLTQGLAVFGWWAILVIWPWTKALFSLDINYQTSLIAFWLPDLLFIGLGSIVASVLIWKASSLDQVAAWTVTGSVSYATLYTLNYTLMTDQGWWGVIFMTPAMIWSGVFSVGLTFERTMFRRAVESSTAWIVVKTFTQIIVVWSIILVIIPYVITIVEDKAGIPRLSFPYQRTIALVLFVVISTIGIYAAYVMSTVGKGTPLPLDHPKNIVIKGPYRYVRNPMAVSGIGQGLAVAMFLGSPLVAAYALMGSLIWQLIFRPLEEDDLQRRFGDDFERYRTNVACWIPRTSPYHID